MSDSISPGATALTLILYLPTSAESAFVAIKAPFATANRSRICQTVELGYLVDTSVLWT